MLQRLHRGAVMMMMVVVAVCSCRMFLTDGIVLVLVLHAPAQLNRAKRWVQHVGLKARKVRHEVARVAAGGVAVTGGYCCRSHRTFRLNSNAVKKETMDQ